MTSVSARAIILAPPERSRAPLAQAAGIAKREMTLLAVETKEELDRSGYSQIAAGLFVARFEIKRRYHILGQP